MKRGGVQYHQFASPNRGEHAVTGQVVNLEAGRIKSGTE